MRAVARGDGRTPRGRPQNMRLREAGVGETGVVRRAETLSAQNHNKGKVCVQSYCGQAHRTKMPHDNSRSPERQRPRKS